MTTINITPSADSYVDIQYPTSNYGTSGNLLAGSTTAFFTVYYKETYMRFPLSQIPANAIISTAKLYLYNTFQANNNFLISNIPTANRTWSETGITWNNKPAYDTSYPNKRTGGVGTNAWSITDITSYVKDMLNQGLAVEFTLSNSPCNGCEDVFVSKDSTDTTHRPYLAVTYSLPVSATNITATPTSCTSPCSTQVSVTWQNNSTISQTFTPGITVDGVLTTQPAVTLSAGANVTKSWNVANLSAGNHIICPSPN